MTSIADALNQNEPGTQTAVSAAKPGPTPGADHPQTPGEVMLFKQAEPVPGKINTWDITLRVEAMDEKKTSDIVLVLDRSGSMKVNADGRTPNDRMVKAKKAAQNFVDQLLPSDTTRIAVVSFSRDVRIDQNLTNNKESLKTAIDGLQANGATFTQGGMRTAREILRNSNADHKHIVFLSDGEPTLAYQIKNRSAYSSWRWLPAGMQYSVTGYTGYRYSLQRGQYYAVTNSGVPENEYSNTVTGMGYAMFNGYYTNSNLNFEDLGAAAIDEADFAKRSNYSVYTIALAAGENGNRVLRQMASNSSQFIETTDTSALQEIFSEIAGRIQGSMKQAAVTDPMGGGFLIPVNSVKDIRASEGTFSVNETSRTLSWQLGDLKTPLSGVPGVRYAEIKYRVTIDSEILKEPVPADGLYRTNGAAAVSFIGLDGKQHTREFPKPRVQPRLLIIEKQLIDSQGNVISDYQYMNGGVTVLPTPDGRSFSLSVMPAGQSAAEYTLAAGQRKVLLDFFENTVYQIEETGSKNADGSASGLADYETTIEIPQDLRNDTDQKILSGNRFMLDARDQKPAYAIKVVNREKKLGSIKVTKQFISNPTRQDLTTVSGRQAKQFFFNVYLDGVLQPALRFSLAAGETKELKELAYGQYQVVEEADEAMLPPTYLDDEKNAADRTDGKVTLTRLAKTRSITVTNRPKTETVRLQIEKHWEGGTNADRPEIRFAIWANGKDTGKSIALKREGRTGDIWQGSSEELLKYDTKAAAIDYTLKEMPVAGYTAGDMVKLDAARFSMTNSRLSSFTLTKKVEGEYADRSRMFHFTVSIDGKEQNIELKDGQSYRFSDLKKGTVIKVREAGAGIGRNYLVSASNGPVSTDQAAGTADLTAVTMGVQDISVTVTNTYDSSHIVPTGILTGKSSAISLFLCAIAVSAIMAVGFKRCDHKA